MQKFLCRNSHMVQVWVPAARFLTATSGVPQLAATGRGCTPQKAVQCALSFTASYWQQMCSKKAQDVLAWLQTSHRSNKVCEIWVYTTWPRQLFYSAPTKPGLCVLSKSWGTSRQIFPQFSLQLKYFKKPKALHTHKPRPTKHNDPTGGYIRN